ncbi:MULTISPECIES: NADH-quinone oxidoreductase subunit A [Thermodesulfobacterium]|uniref:NADH-quinone oxidoreductase subunit A n=2 Tax=Thermodesulfobacterium commune TaxID=1741 RepID=A0A075WW39_9BACT|nr:MULTISPECIES: NADH-quinone oxidoreductase subunit A [Thermodesulfobacterium]HAA84692.1 NADH-quinone oxidoreductase subunit A [Thermodesulfobacterium commune]AIH04713.1 hypothetical protein HL41_08675 [Thermodesulfobacterium commune DSM 2178]MBZ4681307.1 hypothetical protein [Thermodesulfobacterium sp.]MDK2860859.1 NADH-quinone oxidoreductase subunit [Thermodesulfobacterium sp.]MDN5379374.1 NADH-quinone oxidoreductase subunit [Thermodesulfobacterium sp.]
MTPGTYLPIKYLPVFLMLILATIFSVAAIFINQLLSPKKKTAVKLMAYESGNLPSGEVRERFFIGYYVLAILFVVFDVELVFLFPWALTFNSLGFLGFWGMLFFIFLILLGYFYEIKKEALEWLKRS